MCSNEDVIDMIPLSKRLEIEKKANIFVVKKIERLTNVKLKQGIDLKAIKLKLEESKVKENFKLK